MTAVILLAVASGAVVDRAARTADTPPAIENADGLGCHGDKAREATWPGGTPRSLFVDESVFATSIHDRNRCASCHGDIVEVPHPDGFRPKDVSCAQCRAARRIVTQYQLAPDVMSTYTWRAFTASR